jgi:hypothetical protein
VTLVGSLPLAGEEPPALTALAAVLEDVVGSRTSFPVANAGIGWLGGPLIYDVHDWDGAPNLPLVELAAAVDAAVRPLLRPTAPGTLPADVRTSSRWRGHLSLASHDLEVRPELREEVQAYAEGLNVAVPNNFEAHVIALYEFWHSTWAESWWIDMRWAHTRSWPLAHASSR